MESGGRDADGACSNLAACDLSALVTLGVRAGFEPISVDELLVGTNILFKSLQIKNESRRHQLAQTSQLPYQSVIGRSHIDQVCQRLPTVCYTSRKKHHATSRHYAAAPSTAKGLRFVSEEDGTDITSHIITNSIWRNGNPNDQLDLYI